MRALLAAAMLGLGLAEPHPGNVDVIGSHDIGRVTMEIIA